MKKKYLVSECSAKICGEVVLLGDKSISHRAIILGAISTSITTISNFLFCEDCMATLKAFQQMGVKVEIVQNKVIIHGVGRLGFKKPNAAIDCGNSGTTMRLLAGILVGQPFISKLIGDKSLSVRPMDRIIKPLKQMGADISAKNGHAPILIKGVDTLTGITYDELVTSAQVKSCLLFAGMYAKGETTILETGHMRDHTERMLTAFSYPIFKSGCSLTISSKDESPGTNVLVPGDISSAAFFIIAATLIPHSEIIIKDVGMNPGRIGVIKILNLMGASIEIVNKKLFGEEPVADIIVRSASLEGIDIPSSLVPISIDEFPVIFIAAACASGQTLLHGAKELRYKESDRISTMVTGLKELGIDASELDDGVYIRGGKIHGGIVDSCHDHRVAMAFAVAGFVASAPVTIKNSDSIATSFPNFIQIANKLQLKIREYQ